MNPQCSHVNEYTMISCEFIMLGLFSTSVRTFLLLLGKQNSRANKFVIFFWMHWCSIWQSWWSSVAFRGAMLFNVPFFLSSYTITFLHCPIRNGNGSGQDRDGNYTSHPSPVLLKFLGWMMLLSFQIVTECQNRI